MDPLAIVIWLLVLIVVVALIFWPRVRSAGSLAGLSQTG